MVIDIIAGITLLLGFLRGYQKGIIGTIFMVVGLLVAVLGTMKLSPLFINVVQGLMPGNPKLSYIIGFLGTFLLFFLLIIFIGKQLENLFKTVKLNFINKLVGGGFTAVIFIIVFSSILWFTNEAKLLPEKQKDQSITYLQLVTMPVSVVNQFTLLRPTFQEFWEKTNEVFDQARDKGEELQDANR